jgi:DNA-binding LacI/PurR family transcriptional regulator
LIAGSFLAAGARSFALILGDPRGTTSADRARGFSDVLVEAGIARSEIRVIEGQSAYEGAQAAVLRAFRDGDLPDAIFAVNDIMAMAAMDVLRQRRSVRIPEDVMVAGFDDIPDARRWPYRLTTVRQPVEEMVEETLAILHLDDPEIPIERAIDKVVPGRLIWRETVRQPVSRSGTKGPATSA